NTRPAGVPAVTIPARWNSRHPQCTARHTRARRASLIRPVLAFHDITRAFSRDRQPRFGPRRIPQAPRSPLGRNDGGTRPATGQARGRVAEPAGVTPIGAEARRGGPPARPGGGAGGRRPP